MFERSDGKIPGYTGHQRGDEPIDTAPGKKVGIKHIPGKIIIFKFAPEPSWLTSASLIT